jgi:hypothetical protein
LTESERKEKKSKERNEEKQGKKRRKTITNTFTKRKAAARLCETWR